MYNFLVVLTNVSGFAAAIFALCAGLVWRKSSKLPVPELPPDVASPTLDQSGVPIPVSLREEADRRSVLAEAMTDFLATAKKSADMNKCAATFSALAAILTFVALDLALVNNWAIVRHWWSLPS